MSRIRSAAIAALVLSTACYKVTVVTAPEPANARVVDKPWTHSFVYGIVPPGEIDVSKQCTGISRVVTQRSFLNGLVGILTSSIYTPLQVTTTCSNARTATQLGVPLERLGYIPTPESDSTHAAGH